MINIKGLDKAELLAALFNYAYDMKNAKSIIKNSLEATQGFLYIASSEVDAGKTDKTTTIKSTEVKNLIKSITDSKVQSKYLDKTSAQVILNSNKKIKSISNILIEIDFSSNNIDPTKFDSIYGQFSVSNFVSVLKDYISFDKTGKVKKPPKIIKDDKPVEEKKI